MTPACATGRLAPSRAPPAIDEHEPGDDGHRRRRAPSAPALAEQPRRQRDRHDGLQREHRRAPRASRRSAAARPCRSTKPMLARPPRCPRPSPGRRQRPARGQRVASAACSSARTSAKRGARRGDQQPHAPDRARGRSTNGSRDAERQAAGRCTASPRGPCTAVGVLRRADGEHARRRPSTAPAATTRAGRLARAARGRRAAEQQHQARARASAARPSAARARARRSAAATRAPPARSPASQRGAARAPPTAPGAGACPRIGRSAPRAPAAATAPSKHTAAPAAATTPASSAQPAHRRGTIRADAAGPRATLAIAGAAAAHRSAPALAPHVPPLAAALRIARRRDLAGRGRAHVRRRPAPAGHAGRPGDLARARRASRRSSSSASRCGAPAPGRARSSPPATRSPLHGDRHRSLAAPARRGAARRPRPGGRATIARRPASVPGCTAPPYGIYTFGRARGGRAGAAGHRCCGRAGATTGARAATPAGDRRRGHRATCGPATCCSCTTPTTTARRARGGRRRRRCRGARRHRRGRARRPSAEPHAVEGRLVSLGRQSSLDTVSPGPVVQRHAPVVPGHPVAVRAGRPAGRAGDGTAGRRPCPSSARSGRRRCTCTARTPCRRAAEARRVLRVEDLARGAFFNATISSAARPARCRGPR